MWVTIILLVILSVFSAFFYRIGGSSKKAAKKEYPWYPSWAVNGTVRDFGCSMCNYLGLLVMGITAVWWVHLIAFVLVFFAHRTYWDRVFKYDNYFAHGLAIGLSYLPYVLTGAIGVIGYLIRSAVLAVFMGVWCLIFDKDTIEEGGRGGIQPISLLLY